MSLRVNMFLDNEFVHRASAKSKGFALVQFLEPIDAEAAASALDASIFQGRLLHILPAKPIPQAKVSEAVDTSLSVSSRLLMPLTSLSMPYHNCIYWCPITNIYAISADTLLYWCPITYVWLIGKLNHTWVIGHHMEVLPFYIYCCYHLSEFILLLYLSDLSVFFWVVYSCQLMNADCVFASSNSKLNS